MANADKTLVCRDCGSHFVFSSEEQEFFASRGYENEPSRCLSCRAERRRTASRPNNASRSIGTGKSFPATCSSCGSKTQVPFQPRDNRPVYCQDCFRKMRSTR